LVKIKQELLIHEKLRDKMGYKFLLRKEETQSVDNSDSEGSIEEQPAEDEDTQETPVKHKEPVFEPIPEEKVDSEISYQMPLKY
jgi:hypothetical protein